MFTTKEKQSWFDANKALLKKTAVVEEKQNGGDEAVKIKSDRELLILPNESFRSCFISDRKCADVLVCETLDDKSICFHIIELKRTIRDSSWNKVKDQFRSSIKHAFSVGGYLESCEVKKINVYTAFRYDKLKTQATPNPILLKNEIGKNPSSSIDWNSRNLKLLGKNMLHKKIQLDEDGCGVLKINLS